MAYSTKEIEEKYKSGNYTFEEQSKKAGESPLVSAGLPVLSGLKIEINSRYSSTFGSDSFEAKQARMKKDISRITQADRDRVKSVISNFDKNFRLKYYPEYKANRKGKEKPKFFKEAKEEFEGIFNIH